MNQIKCAVLFGISGNTICTDTHRRGTMKVTEHFKSESEAERREAVTARLVNLEINHSRTPSNVKTHRTG